MVFYCLRCDIDLCLNLIYMLFGFLVLIFLFLFLNDNSFGIYLILVSFRLGIFNRFWSLIVNICFRTLVLILRGIFLLFLFIFDLNVICLNFCINQVNKIIYFCFFVFSRVLQFSSQIRHLFKICVIILFKLC